MFFSVFSQTFKMPENEILETNEIPEWLNHDFIKNIIKIQENEDTVEIIDFNVKPPVAKGDNYASKIVRVSFTFQSPNFKKATSRSVLLKTLPDGEFMQAFINEMNLFERENEVFLKIMPEMKKLYREETGENFSLSAKGVFSSIEKTVILEDLSPGGFQMANRSTGLDFAHTSLALTNLGKFHAVSYALNRKLNGHLEIECTENVFNENTKEKMNGFYSKALKDIAEIIKDYPESKKYSSTLLEISEGIGNKIIELAKLNKDDFACLIHGDFWVNNMLFKYSEKNELEDMRFVDFQLTRWNNPAFDLLYFLFSSIQDEVRVKRTDDLLKIYYNSLRRNLNRMHCEDVKYSFENLMADFKKIGVFGVVIASTLMPIIKVDKENVPDFKDVTEEDLKGDMEMLKKTYRSEAFRKTYPLLLNDAIERGFLE